MIRATISQTKNTLSALLEKVKAGETVLILDRDTPVATLMPVSLPDNASFLRLIKTGAISPGARKPGSLPQPVKSKESALKALLQERAEGR